MDAEACGRTAYFQMRGKNYNGVIVPFGECILFKVAPDDKYEDRWGKGVMVGKADQTDEFIVLTPAGACKSRSVRRLEDKDQYDKEFMASCVGSPWKPKNSAQAAGLKVSGDKLAAGVRIHRLHITKKLFKTYGRTDGCPLCEGLGPTQNSDCRLRIERALVGSGEGMRCCEATNLEFPRDR